MPPKKVSTKSESEPSSKKIRNSNATKNRGESNTSKNMVQTKLSSLLSPTSKYLVRSERTTRSIGTALESKNYLFYMNKIPSAPSGDLIDNFHKHWFGNYYTLEVHHGYIQWLFPVFENSGLNWQSSALTKAEAKLIRETMECAKRVVRSYKLMLDFYGIMMVNEETGELKRTKNYHERYLNLNGCSHNYLRISRILISLGEMGFCRYKKPLVDHFTKEITQNGVLQNAKRSLETFWTPLLDETSAAYIKKTKESKEDRLESVFFTKRAWLDKDTDLRVFKKEASDHKEEKEEEEDEEGNGSNDTEEIEDIDDSIDEKGGKEEISDDEDSNNNNRKRKKSAVSPTTTKTSFSARRQKK